MEQKNDSGMEINFKLSQKTSHTIIFKIVLLLLIGGVWGYFESKDAIKKLEIHERISVEKCSKQACIDEVLAYKEIVESGTYFANPSFAILSMTIGMAILFGAYELLAMLIGFAVKKIID